MMDEETIAHTVICPRDHKSFPAVGGHLRCETPCDYLDCPWGPRAVERRIENERTSVAFMCGGGSCTIKPYGMLWTEVYEQLEERERRQVVCPCCGEEFEADA